MSSDTPKLVGTHEIGDLLGVSRQRVHQLINRPDFPAPLARLRCGVIWAYADVKTWAEANGRTIDD